MRLRKLAIIFFCLFFSPLLEARPTTIGIFTFKFHLVGHWDPDSVNSGITGSEEAVIYMSKELAELGYQVTVYGNPPPDSPYTDPDSNPRYVDLYEDDNSHLDIAISWRMPQKGSSLRRRADKVYLWPHDLCARKLKDSYVNCFDDVLWISSWQRKQWISKTPKFSAFRRIFGNGIEPDQFGPILERKNPHSCVYGSNYARGLEQLLDIWPQVKERFPDASLDIYYGWHNSSALKKETETKMKKQIKEYHSLSVTEHGKVGHEKLNQAFAQASLWTYPCNFDETFCITASRAQASGALPVIINRAALAETVNGGFSCSKKQEYLDTLLAAMEYAETMALEEREQLRAFVFEKYTWKKIAEQWDDLFQGR